MRILRIFIADSHPGARWGVRALFARHDRYSIVGEAVDGFKAVEEVLMLKPDIVIMEMELPGLDGISATKRITSELPEIKVIIESINREARCGIDAFQSGAIGYVLKGDLDELFAAVKKAESGMKYASPQVAELMLESLVSAIKSMEKAGYSNTLSSRERDIIRLITSGATSKEAADRLSMPLATFKRCRKDIMRKLKVDSVAGLLKASIRNGIIKLG